MVSIQLDFLSLLVRLVRTHIHLAGAWGKRKLKLGGAKAGFAWLLGPKYLKSYRSSIKRKIFDPSLGKLKSLLLQLFDPTSFNQGFKHS